MNRWQRSPDRDVYVDSLGIYAPVTSLETWRWNHLFPKVDPKSADMILTQIARKRQHRCRPWKKARA